MWNQRTLKSCSMMLLRECICWSWAVHTPYQDTHKSISCSFVHTPTWFVKLTLRACLFRSVCCRQQTEICGKIVCTEVCTATSQLLVPRIMHLELIWSSLCCATVCCPDRSSVYSVTWVAGWGDGSQLPFIRPLYVLLCPSDTLFLKGKKRQNCSKYVLIPR